jgi:glycosyltransferase involved in cell wall biosynthesis
MIHLVTWLPLPYQRSLCRALAEAYGSHFVAWFAERTHRDFPYQSAAPDGFVHHYLSEVGYRKLLKDLRSDAAAVVILCGWSSRMTNNTLMLTSLLRVPVFIWADHPHPRERSILVNLARKSFLCLLARKAKGFLACGKPTVEHLVSLGIERSKITNFPYWIDLPNEWTIPERCWDEAASKSPLRLVAIGRFVSLKQFEVAIEAVALANKRAGYQLAELVLAGDGQERANLETLTRSSGCETSVSFPGWLEPGEVHEELIRSDALVVTSSFEPYGVVVLEAMAAGRPVLASQGVMAAQDRDEGTGAVLLHPFGDVECLANQIVSLAIDRELLARGALAARATAEKWPSSRAAAIIGRLVNQAIPGETSLQRTNGADSEFVACHPVTKSGQISIATNRK